MDSHDNKSLEPKKVHYYTENLLHQGYKNSRVKKKIETDKIALLWRNLFFLNQC